MAGFFFLLLVVNGKQALAFLMFLIHTKRKLELCNKNIWLGEKYFMAAW
jgi:hypothetical protein